MSKTNTKTQDAVQTDGQPVQLDHDPVALGALPSKSAKIRYLTGQGMKRGRIAKILDIRYQHVRNVQITPVKRV